MKDAGAGFRLRLPATSANLGPGFDTLGLALALYLEIEARAAADFHIDASGRDATVCASTRRNLLLETYTDLLVSNGRPVVPLHLRMENVIPVGMGCGSSAAVRLAAVALASHFGGLGWERQRILEEACGLEGHPDNAAACWLGGFVASGTDGDRVHAVSFPLPPEWRAVIVMPERPLPTTASRAVLPEVWPKADVIANLQRVALLTAAMAGQRSDLLADAMRDWLHQPYRARVCPLLMPLLRLGGDAGVAGAALSGAGPAVLLLTTSPQAAEQARLAALESAAEAGPMEILICGLESRVALAEALE